MSTKPELEQKVEELEQVLVVERGEAEELRNQIAAYAQAQDQLVKDLEEVRRSREAAWVTFTNVIHPTGVKFPVTVREGVTEDEVTAMFEAHSWIVGKAMEQNYEFDVQKAVPTTLAPPTPPPLSSGEEAPKTKQNNNPFGKSVQGIVNQHNAAQGGTFNIVKVMVGTTKNGDPDVQFYTDQPGKRDYKVLHCAPTILINRLMDKYGDTLDQGWLNDTFNTIGSVIDGQNWKVMWVPSPKNSAWKDIVSVTVPEFETEIPF